MRILLLPLTRRHTLLYAQRLTENEANKPNRLVAWAMARTQKTWADWENSNTKWKKKTVETANRLLDKIDWEEYSVKTVHNPATTTSEKVSVVHPSWVEGSQINAIVEDIVRRRRPIHHKYRWRWAIAMPVTLPFSLVPVLPNFPLFYAAYRFWSHHKALKGTKYLEDLVKSDALLSSPSPVLDNIYSYGLKKTPTLTLEDVKLKSSKQELLISPTQLASIANKFKEKDIAVLGNRAISQLTKSLDGEQQQDNPKDPPRISGLGPDITEKRERKKRRKNM